MNARQLIRQTAARFREAGVPDPEVDASVLLGHVTGRAPLSLRLDTDFEPDEGQLAAYASLCGLRVTRRPLQYLLGVQRFWGRDFHVDERVLIPRPETELLAERAVARLRQSAGRTALDLCCGSGCIAVTMALEVPGSRVDAADISPDALEVARCNVMELGAGVTLRQGDLWAAVEGRRYDVIVSNPPYIPLAECGKLQAEVMREPSLALNGGMDGLDFYRRIAGGAQAHLNVGGAVLLEVGWNQAEDVCRLMRDAGFDDVEAYRDLNGVLRMVEARLRS